jgi:tetratricopeptide (TPR) repeat protein
MMKFSLWSVLALVFLCAPLALSQPEGAARLEQAKVLFKEAEVSYRVGEFALALEGYKQAYLLSQASGLLYNMAQCQRHLGLYDESLRSYRLYLQDTPDSPYRDTVEKTIFELDALVKAPKGAPQALPAEPPAALLAPEAPTSLAAPRDEPSNARKPPGFFLPAAAFGVGAALGGAFFIMRRSALLDGDFRSGEQQRLIIIGATADLTTLAAGTLLLLTHKKRRAHAANRALPIAVLQ